MKVRIISALVALAVVLPCLFFGEITGLTILIFLIAVIGTDEYLRMNVPEDKKIWPFFHLAVLGLLAAFVFGDPSIHLPVIGGALILLFSAVLLLTKDNEHGMRIMMSLGTGLLYLPVLLLFFIKLRQLPHGLLWLFLPLIITWLADTGAYFTGRKFGKKKLFPRVSPKKTWEGVYGGVVLAMVGGCVYMHFVLPETPIYHGVILGFLLAVMSVIGDLVESLMKRARNIKDSGWIMPGHGGILDRMDSLFFAVPIAWLYAAYILKLV